MKSGERLRLAIERRGWSVKEFERRIAPLAEEQRVRGASYANIHRIFAGEGSGPFLRLAAEVLGVLPEWLIDGTGAMVAPDLELDVDTAAEVAGTPADRVRLALQGRGTTLWLHDRLVERAGDGEAIVYSELQRFLQGDVDLPDSALEAVASVLEVPTDWLERGGDDPELGGKPTGWLNEQVRMLLMGMYLADQDELVRLFHMCLDRAVAALIAGPSVEEIAEIARHLHELINYPLHRLVSGSIGRSQAGEFYTLQLLAILRAIPGRGTVADAATLIERLTTDELPRLHFDLNA